MTHPAEKLRQKNESLIAGDIAIEGDKGAINPDLLRFPKDPIKAQLQQEQSAAASKGMMHPADKLRIKNEAKEQAQAELTAELESESAPEALAEGVYAGAAQLPAGLAQLAAQGLEVAGMPPELRQSLENYMNNLNQEQTQRQEISPISATTGEVVGEMVSGGLGGAGILKGGQALAKTPYVKDLVERMGSGVASQATKYGTASAIESGAEFVEPEGNRAKNAMWGALFGAGLGTSFDKIAKTWRDKYKPEETPTTDDFTQYAEQLGVDPSMSRDEDLHALLLSHYQEGKTGQQTVEALIDEGIDFVPKTLGELGRKGGGERWQEEVARQTDAYGEDLQEAVRNFDQWRSGQLNQVIKNQEADLGITGKPIESLSDVGQSLGQQIKSRGQAMNRKASKLYDSIDYDNFFVTGDEAVQMLDYLEQILRKNRLKSVNTHPSANRLLETIQETRQGLTDPTQGQQLWSLEQIDGLKQDIGQFSQAAKNDGDKFQIDQVGHAFREWRSDSAQNGRLRYQGSNPKEMEKLIAADKLWAQYAGFFRPSLEKNKAAYKGNQFLEKTYNEDLNARAVVEGLFGAGHQMPKTAINNIRALERLFGKDSPQMKEVKQALFNKLLRPLDKLNLDDIKKGQNSNIAKYIKTLDNNLVKNKQVFDMLFTPEELKRFKSFSNDLQKIIPDEKILNPSRTGWVMERLTKKTNDAQAMGASLFAAASLSGMSLFSLAAPVTVYLAQAGYRKNKANKILESIGLKLNSEKTVDELTTAQQAALVSLVTLNSDEE